MRSLKRSVGPGQGRSRSCAGTCHCSARGRVQVLRRDGQGLGQGHGRHGRPGSAQGRVPVLCGDGVGVQKQTRDRFPTSALPGWLRANHRAQTRSTRNRRRRPHASGRRQSLLLVRAGDARRILPWHPQRARVRQCPDAARWRRFELRCQETCLRHPGHRTWRGTSARAAPSRSWGHEGAAARVAT